MAEHTPTPWTHVADRNLECRHIISLDPDEPGSAMMIGNVIKPADAAFIVKAVNDYAKLEASCAAMKAALEHIRDFDLTEEYNEPIDEWLESRAFTDVQDHARGVLGSLAALTQANGEGGRDGGD